MNNGDRDRDEARWLRVTGGGVVLLGLTVVAGWFLDFRPLVVFVPGGSPMVMNATLCMTLAGAGLLALAEGWNFAAGMCGAIAALFSGICLLQFVLGASLGVDELFWRHGIVAPLSEPGRMTPNTALALMLAGLAVAIMAKGLRMRWALPLLGGMVAGFAVFTFVGYAVTSILPQSGMGYRGMPIQAGLGLLLLALAILRGAGREEAGDSTALPFLSAAFGTLISVGVISVQSNADVIGVNQWVVHTHEVRGSIDHFVSQVARMESSARGYSLSGVEAFRSRYDVHRKEVVQMLDELELLTADNPVQLWRVRRLRSLAAQKFEQGAAMLRARDEGGATAAARVLTAQPEAVTSALVNLGDQVRDEEVRLLAQRERERTIIEENARAVQVFGGLLAVALVGLAVSHARRSAAARRAAEQSLRASHATLEQRVAERTRALEQVNSRLRESERSMRFLADAMPQLVYTLRPDGVAETFNRGWVEYSGLSEDESREGGWAAAVHPDDLAEADRKNKEMIRTGRESSGEIRIRRASDGAYRWMLWRARPELDSAGRIVRWVGTSTDIHEQKAHRELLEQRVLERTAELAASQESLARARDEALAASRLKSEFLANMSHEIRTPMNGIIGMAGLLMETDLTPDQKEMGKVIESSSEGLLSIINDILDFSRIEAGKLKIEAALFDLREVIDETTALLAIRAQAKGVGLRSDFEAGLDTSLFGDAGRLRQVLINLVGNAVKFTEKGEVVVEVRRTLEAGGRLSFRCAVRDTGIGVPPESRKLLFQPFTQGDGTTTRRYGGTGLGLAISRQLVQLMGGEIGFESEPGRGSCFWFELSLPRSGAAGPVAGERPESRRPTAGLRLLMAEDNQVNQAVGRRILEKMGHSVDIVGDGLAAIARLSQRAYDAVLMDCQMPDLDGYEATRRIREGLIPGVNPRIPIIALTAYAMEEDRMKCIAAGMNDYVTKPVRQEDLYQAFLRCGLLVSA